MAMGRLPTNRQSVAIISVWMKIVSPSIIFPTIYMSKDEIKSMAKSSEKTTIFLAIIIFPMLRFRLLSLPRCSGFSLAIIFTAKRLRTIGRIITGYQLNDVAKI